MKRFVLALIITVIGFVSFADTLIKVEAWSQEEGYICITDKNELIQIESKVPEVSDMLYDTESVMSNGHAYWIDKYRDPESGEIVYLTYFRW